MKSPEEYEEAARIAAAAMHADLRAQMSELKDEEIQALLDVLPVIVDTQEKLIAAFKVLAHEDLQRPMKETIAQLGKTATMINQMPMAKASKQRKKLRRTAEEIARAQDQMESMRTYIMLLRSIQQTTSSSHSGSPLVLPKDFSREEVAALASPITTSKR